LEDINGIGEWDVYNNAIELHPLHVALFEMDPFTMTDPEIESRIKNIKGIARKYESISTYKNTLNNMMIVNDEEGDEVFYLKHVYESETLLPKSIMRLAKNYTEPEPVYYVDISAVQAVPKTKSPVKCAIGDTIAECVQKQMEREGYDDDNNPNPNTNNNGANGNRIQLNVQQKQAVEMAMKHDISIVSGGPGTGKTTTLKTILTVLEETTDAIPVHTKICLMAPTGKAAQVMQRSCGIRSIDSKCVARTIAVVLKNNALRVEYKNSIVIIDEMSMVSTEVLGNVFRILSPSKLIMVGDPNQLPPVNGFPCFRDMISSGKIPHVELTQVHRQRAGTALIQNLGKLHNAQISSASHFNTDDEMIVKITPSPFDYIKAFCTPDRIQNTQFLGLTNKTATKVNTIVQNLGNPDGNPIQCSTNAPESAKHLPNACIPRMGDKVMCVENFYFEEKVPVKTKEKNPDRPGHWIEKVTHKTYRYLAVANGCIGWVKQEKTKGNKESLFVEYNALDRNGFPVVFKDTIEFGKYKTTFVLAYCITVHKSQGDQFKNGVILLESNFRRPPQSLMYTGLSRFEHSCVLLGTSRDFANVLSGESIQHRQNSEPTHFIRALQDYVPCSLDEFRYVEDSSAT